MIDRLHEVAGLLGIRLGLVYSPTMLMMGRDPMAGTWRVLRSAPWVNRLRTRCLAAEAYRRSRHPMCRCIIRPDPE